MRDSATARTKPEPALIADELAGDRWPSAEAAADLARRIESSRAAQWNAISIGKSVRGFSKSKGADHQVPPHMHPVIGALADKVSDSTAKLDARHIGMACYGLRSMDASSERVKKLLDALATKFIASSAAGPHSRGDECAAQSASLSGDRLAQCDAAIGLLGVYRSSSIPAAMAKLVFPDASAAMSCDLFKKKFVQFLKNECVQEHEAKKIVDLHGLNHGGAQLLLESISHDLTGSNETKIICGVGGRRPGAMAEVVKSALLSSGLDCAWQADKGCVTIRGTGVRPESHYAHYLSEHDSSVVVPAATWQTVDGAPAAKRLKLTADVPGIDAGP